MAKKPFGWVRDAEEPVIPSPPRVSRAEKSARSQAAVALAKSLVALPARELPHLGLPEDVLEGVLAYAEIPSTGGVAKKRQLSRLGTLLLIEDIEAIEEAVGSGRKGQTQRQDQVDAMERLRQRIVAEGQKAEDAFVATYPSIDRQRLRQLAANARKAQGTPQEKRVNKKLLLLLREAAGLT